MSLVTNTLQDTDGFFNCYYVIRSLSIELTGSVGQSRSLYSSLIGLSRARPASAALLGQTEIRYFYMIGAACLPTIMPEASDQFTFNVVRQIKRFFGHQIIWCKLAA